MARRRPTQTGRTPRAFGRELAGRPGRPMPSQRPRRVPALLAVVAGLGAAGAAVLKRRRGGDNQPPGYFPPPDPVGEPTLEIEAPARPRPG